jgi:SNF2 family DNA or RNA helicase
MRANKEVNSRVSAAKVKLDVETGNGIAMESASEEESASSFGTASSSSSESPTAKKIKYGATRRTSTRVADLEAAKTSESTNPTKRPRPVYESDFDSDSDDESSAFDRKLKPKTKLADSAGADSSKNSIPMAEVVQADRDRIKNLARYRLVFKPFVTEKVLATLNASLMDKTDKVSLKATDTGGGAGAVASEVVLKQPFPLSPLCKMRDYQLEGLSFLVQNYNRSINCILADEMGLGKTLQSIAFVAQLALVQRVKGPFLFVVPLSVLFNWIVEFKKWCPALNVVRLHSIDATEQLRLRKVLQDPRAAHVVVTTYETVRKGGLSVALHRIVWRALFLDEGHRMRHEDSEITRACHSLRSRFRVILTGTPVHNNLHEFGALLHFLAPNIFTDLELFDEAFDLNISGKQKAAARAIDRKQAAAAAAANTASSRELGAASEEDTEEKDEGKERTSASKSSNVTIDRALLEKANLISKAFVLRRLKAEVEQKLPPKLETKINCPMTEMQKALTRALLFKEKALVSRLGISTAAAVAGKKSIAAQGGANSSSGSSGAMGSTASASASASHVEAATNTVKRDAQHARLLSLLSQLRKAANHPYLFNGVERVAIDGLPTEEIVTTSGKMLILDRLLAALYAKGHRVVLFSQYTRTLDM